MKTVALIHCSSNLIEGPSRKVTIIFKFGKIKNTSVLLFDGESEKYDINYEDNDVMNNFSEIFNNKFSNIDTIISHNAESNINILKTELQKSEKTSSISILDNIRVICCAEKIKSIVNIKDNNGELKIPSVEEVYNYVFKNSKQVDNSFYITDKLFYCLLHLQNNDIINFFQENV